MKLCYWFEVKVILKYAYFDLNQLKILFFEEKYAIDSNVFVILSIGAVTSIAARSD